VVIAGKAQPTEANVIAPETPAPLQPAGKTFEYNFDSDTVEQMPAKFQCDEN